jgi:hypothetical protein
MLMVLLGLSRTAPWPISSSSFPGIFAKTSTSLRAATLILISTHNANLCLAAVGAITGSATPLTNGFFVAALRRCAVEDRYSALSQRRISTARKGVLVGYGDEEAKPENFPGQATMLMVSRVCLLLGVTLIYVASLL